MSEADALLKIAEAIRSLAVAVGGVSLVLWLMFFLKDMGKGSDVAAKMKDRERTP